MNKLSEDKFSTAGIVKKNCRKCIQMILDSHVYRHAVNSEPNWAPWTAWTQCTASCGGGVREMRRDCLNGSKCIGADTKLKHCNEEECPGKQIAYILVCVVIL